MEVTYPVRFATASYDGEIQVDLRHDMPVQAKVLVRSIGEAGSLRVLYRSRAGTEHELTWRDYKKPPRSTPVQSYDENSRNYGNHLE